MEKNINKHWSETMPIEEILEEEGSREWYEGIEAFKNGLSVGDSPYDNETISGCAWFKGFNHQENNGK